MKTILRYLGTSGFALYRQGERDQTETAKDGQTSKELVIIDSYERRPLADIAHFANVLVLASHAHFDHFSLEVLEWRHENPAICYILSSDIARRFNRKIPNDANVQFISPGDAFKIGELEIRAFGSTDAGCSFGLIWPDIKVFHAGDFNLWDWKKESTPEEVREAESQFETILSDIARGMPRPDLALFPVDPRMEIDYYRGAVRFAQTLRPKLLVPMHFGKVFDPPPGFWEEMNPWTTAVALQPNAQLLASP